jgi:uncharacterized membrane protein
MLPKLGRLVRDTRAAAVVVVAAANWTPLARRVVAVVLVSWLSFGDT